MEITNVRIKNVTVGLDSRHNLSARMTFENQYATCDWSFSLTDPVDVHRLMKLMSYAGTNTVQKLNGKIVRKIDHNNNFSGFGDPIKDKFIPVFGEDLKEVTSVQFKKLLKEAQ